MDGLVLSLTMPGEKMARMYSRKKGKASSKKPLKKETKLWQRYSAKEIERLIIKLAKEGNTASKIGLILRDSYGIPDVKDACGKKITQVLEEKGIKQELPEDLLNLMKKANKIRKHLKINHTDMTAKRGLQLTESKIRRLARYYIKIGKLPKGWKYTPKLAELVSA